MCHSKNQTKQTNEKFERHCCRLIQSSWTHFGNDILLRRDIAASCWNSLFLMEKEDLSHPLPYPVWKLTWGGMHPLSYPDALRNESKAALEVAASVLTFQIILKAQCPPLPPASTVSPENKAEQPRDWVILGLTSALSHITAGQSLPSP